MSGSLQEAEEIILLSFRQIGCPIDENEISSIEDLVSKPDVLVDVVVRSIWLISDGQAKFPVQLPSGIAARHRICTIIASKVKELGYAGDCGYNQLLYPNETSTRQLLVWLIEKLPRFEEEAAGEGETLGYHALLNRRLKAALHIWWHDPYCCPVVVSSKEDDDNYFRLWDFRTFPLVVEGAAAPLLPLVTAQVSDIHYFPSSVFEMGGLKMALAQIKEELDLGLSSDKQNKSDLLRGAFTQASLNRKLNRGSLKGLHRQGSSNDVSDDYKLSRFAHAIAFGQEPDTDANLITVKTAAPPVEEADSEGLSAEELRERAKREAEAAQLERERELASLQARLEELEARSTRLQKEKDLEETALRQLEGELLTLGHDAEALEKAYLIKRKTLEMLPNAAEHMVKLQNICAAAAKKLVELGQEWESHRRPLVEGIWKAKQEKQRRKERSQEMVEEIQSCRQEMQSMAQEMREKEERVKLLEEEYKRTSKSINRNMYTHRILDIISSISKQKQGIDRIIADIRDVQREINAAGATLSRIDAITDEKIFKAANEHQKDAALVASYRQLTDLRQRFELVANAVRDIGQRETECRDVESRIKLLASRLSSNDMYERIKHDLKDIREENAALLAQLNAKG